MNKFILSTDSGCDWQKSELSAQNIFYIPLVYIEDDNTYYDNFDSTEDYFGFYDELKAGRQYKTAGLNPYDLEQHFLELLKHGKDVIHVSLSSGLSGTYGVAKHVAENINKTSKNKIYVLDSKSATGGQGIIVYRAKELRNQGLGAEEAYEKLKDIVSRLSVGFFVANLDTLRRGGRISPLAATVGKMLQLRPMLEIDTDGKLQVIDKVIGTKKAIQKLVERLNCELEENSPIYITCSNNQPLVEELKIAINSKVKNPNIITNYIGPVIGSHTGPEILALIFIKK